MPKLTGVERVFKAVNHQEPDTVPTLELDIHINVIKAIKPGLGTGKPFKSFSFNNINIFKETESGEPLIASR